MKTYTTTYTVEFCHCDRAGIVYYPNFYIWFDQSTERMFKNMGYSYIEMQEKLGIYGAPLLETGASYKVACELGDEMLMTSWVDEFDHKTFVVKHVLTHADGRVALEGFEKRITVKLDADSEKGLKSAAIPTELIELFKS